MGINTLTVTYFLAIDRAPFLKEIFPSFLHYAVVIIIIGIPLLVLTGFVHYKKIPGYKSEAEVNVESNPYTYKLSPGFWLHVIMPFYLLTSKILVKLSNNEKLTDDELKEISKLQKKMDHLLKGGYVGDKSKKTSFDLSKIE